MAIQLYATQSARIGKLKGEILAHAVPVEVLGITGVQKEMPKNNSDTVVFRRWLPKGATNNSADGWGNRFVTGTNVATYASSHLTVEGQTPTADSLAATDVVIPLAQYSCLYSVSDKTFDLYEDDVPAEMKKQTGERIGLVREMVRYGAIKGLSNVFHGGTGNSIATVNGTISINLLRKITRSLKANHAKMVTGFLAPSANVATVPVEASYLVFCSTDLEPAIRDLPGFKHTAEYGTRKMVHEQEIGSVESFRFVLSPELAPTFDAGVLVGATGLQATGTKIDIYPMIVVGEDAWGQVALRGTGALDVSWIPPGQKDKQDPLGQMGYIGAKTYMAAAVLNNGWGAIAWVGTPAL